MRRRSAAGGLAILGSLTVLCGGAAGALAQGTTAAGVGSGDPSQSVQAPATVGPLVVTMSASPTVASVGQSVTYTAQVSGVPPGKQVLYHWAFEGGTGFGEQITHSYSNPGDYPVAVTVTVSSVAGLSGAADTLTVVASPSKPSKAPGGGGSVTGAGGSGTGKGGAGAGSGKPGGRRVAAARRLPSGVANPLATQTPSAQTGQQVQGFLLTDSGLPFVPPSAVTPASTSGSSGGSGPGLGGVGGAAGVGGALALTIAIVTLGALDERRRISLRNS
jgi:hypothetical protein